MAGAGVAPCLGRDMVGGWRLETGHLLSVWDRINRKRVSEREKGAEDPLVSPGPLYILNSF